MSNGATMTITLNDTLGVKRNIKHFDFSEPYWEGTKQKKLVLQHCKATGKFQLTFKESGGWTCKSPTIQWRVASIRR